MKALQIFRHGEPTEVVKLMDIPEPGVPKPEEVLVMVEYAPINESELLMIKGHYPLRPTSFPSGLGHEGVARILSVGSGVKIGRASYRERVLRLV